MTEKDTIELPNEELLALCDSQMEESLQDELSDLLARKQGAVLKITEQRRLDDLMESYRVGLVRKALALKVAVERDLRPPLRE